MRFFACISILLAAGCARPPKANLVGYLGGAGGDDCDGVASDKAGGVYLACHSDSQPFPGLTPNMLSARPSMQAVIAKIDSLTGRVLWATRTRGTIFDAAVRIELSQDGGAYALGLTRSPDLATTDDAIQRQYGGGENDLFLLKLDPKGNVLYSTFLGGSGNDEGTGLVVADNGAVFIGGMTTSADFPGIRARRYGGGGRQDGFVVRFTPGVSSGLQTVLIGGEGDDRVSDLDFHASGNLVLGGSTGSANFPVKEAFQSRLAGETDAFLAGLNAYDLTLSFATYIGGSRLDAIWALRWDAKGGFVASGSTESDDFPTSKGAFQKRLSGKSSAFIVSLDPADGRLKWSTYYGGFGETYGGGGVDTDETGRIWFIGVTKSSSLPTQTPYQSSFGGGEFDSFLAAFSPDGRCLCYSTYFGGTGRDVLEGLAVTGTKVYATGMSSSRDLKQVGPRIQSGFAGGEFDAVVLGLDASGAISCR